MPKETDRLGVSLAEGWQHPLMDGKCQ
jgi:hypothetical protein